MSTFQTAFEVGDQGGLRWEPVEAWVDTGSTYTWLAAETLRNLGVEPSGSREFDTAGGAVIQRQIGEARVRLEGEEHATIVVFGDEGVPALLGAVTLESFGLAVDPLHHRLIRVRALAL